jgi:hypothetical protein
MDYRRAVALWSSGMLAAALSVALLVASRLQGSVWHDPWFVLNVTVAVVAFAILVVSGCPIWRDGFAAGRDRRRVRSSRAQGPTRSFRRQCGPRGSAVNATNGVTLWLVVLAGRSYYPQANIRLPTC